MPSGVCQRIESLENFRNENLNDYSIPQAEKHCLFPVHHCSTLPRGDGNLTSRRNTAKSGKLFDDFEKASSTDLSSICPVILL